MRQIRVPISKKREVEEKQKRIYFKRGDTVTKTAIGIFDERQHQAEEFEFEERQGRSRNRVRSRVVEVVGESPSEGVHGGGDLDFEGVILIMRMALLTFSLVGLQFTWGIEMTYCTPYLLSLGLTKSKTSLVWIAGPLSGLIMAPLVGAMADRSLDFAINAVQWSCRSLIVDTLPIQKQQSGSAWASRMAAMGHLIGYDAPHEIKESKDALGDIGRIGSMSLVVFSFVSSFGSFLLPLLIKSPDEDNFTQRPPASIARFVQAYNKYKPDLLGAWFVGHLMFSSAMFLAPFASSFRFATSLIAFLWIVSSPIFLVFYHLLITSRPWSVASWAPYAFLGVEVNKMSGIPSYSRLSTTDRDIELDSPTAPPSPSLLRLEHGPSGEKEDIASTGELSGIYFGILNIYTTIPQFIGTFISMIVFSILEPGKSPELAQNAKEGEHHGTEGPNAISVCLFIGAISTIGAAYATKKLRDLQ
ncbi:hypothetical protein DID88_005856 [Monilinia fructigena]|uniref:Major facilitator superfamily (MFS) profile domain-containing protein n=1 Tax=Monilinia fructigena TaxID=38457 RepID=A0A395J261_9HELO|nr:hypothetical protein DID88_005856 [Monilinia fructigena]